MPAFKTQQLTIDGMHCDACVRRVTQALGSTPGVRVSTVEIGKARVLAEPECEPEIRKAIEQAGYSLQAMHAEG